MDESYHFHKLPSSSSSSTSPSTFPATVSSSPSSPPDEISLFLQQFLLRTSSSPSLTGKQPHCSLLSSPPSIFSNTHPSYGGNEISAVDSYLRPNTVNAYSSSVGASENENDEFDCESEEGLMEEIPTKCNNRSSSKRSRAAEVHNLSEKRRRSRINEKMKALQNLIPNSNKTDKASMLDEAIEYLKQLQLQVQMLTMRNGLSLHPMSLPGSLQYLQFSHMRMNFGEENSSLPTDQERSTQIVFSLADQRTTSNHQLTADIDKIDAEAPFKLQPSIQAHFAPFHLSESSKDICREDVLRDRQVSMNQRKTTPFEFELGSMAGVSPPYNMAAAELQNSVPVEQCIIEGDHSALTQEGLHQVKQ